MKPIETRYKGYRFRSRLEARWAVFFDALGLRWEYEPQGFHLPDGNYLPDFWLTSFGMWAEVKPDAAGFDWPICEQLAVATGRDVIALIGPPDIAWYEVTRAPFEYEENGKAELMQPLREWLDFGMSRHKERAWFGWEGVRPDARHLFKTGRFEAAVNAALGARFEHGESSAPRPEAPAREVAPRQWKKFVPPPKPETPA